jgi:quinol monooxygenase YgiN
MSNLTIVAKVVAKKDCIEAVKTELLKLVEPTRRESGCIEYRLHQDNDDPAVFIFYENWESGTCLEQHINAAHFKAYLRAVDALVEEKTVHKMTGIQ